jgi:NADPH:quinone reductase-like Zn-dependent oxidoreductase
VKAAVYRRFGAPEVVSVEEVRTPTPRRGEVLIRVRASTVSAADYRARTRIVPKGLAVPVALSLGVFRPRRRILGMDVAGVVEAVGCGVTSFAPGDEVIAMLGAKFGGHAQYVRVRTNAAIAPKPRNMTFAEAVAVVFGGVTAQSFLDRTAIHTGTTVLVNGASGAVGTAAIQLAKQLGANVTAVSSSGNHDLVTALGADRAIDYNATDFTTQNRSYDVIVDCVGNAPFDRVSSSLSTKGTLLLVIADLKSILGAARTSHSSGKLISVAAVKYTSEALQRLVIRAELGRLRPVIDRTYGLSEIQEAHRYVEAGHKRGSVVLELP